MTWLGTLAIEENGEGQILRIVINKYEEYG